MRRVMLFDRQDRPIGELSEAEVFELVRKEEINGEHALTVTTTRVLQQGWRVLTQDGRGKWREHVVFGTDALHDSGAQPFGTYYCVWSLQHDLMGTRVSAMPGVQTPVAAGVALAAALGGTARWAAGTVTNTATGGASMYDTDGWSAMGVLIGEWGGEIDARIEVGSSGITARLVDYYAMQGDQDAKRRFDFGADLTSVRRKIADGPLYCRVTPRGRGEESGAGYGRKITIESVNQGRDYLEKAAMVELAKLPDGSGGWEYPTIEIENPDCETPGELKAWAQSVLDDYTLPNITYDVDVLQLAAEGTDMHGVSLGDAVQVVDGKFDNLRISGRVTAESVNMLDEQDVQLRIGYIDGGLAGVLGGMGSRIAALTGAVEAMNGGSMSTADYLSRLLERINAEINATGGYTYITEGQGIRTYDSAVSDPLEGDEASAVVEIKGGTIRIANSRTAQGDWNWRTVFTSGRIAADMVTAANITTGYIGSAAADGSYSGTGNYWNLDTGELRMAASATIGGQTVQQIASSAAGAVNTNLNQTEILRRLTGGYTTEGLYISNGHLYINAAALKTGILTDGVGKNYWNLNTGEFSLQQDIGGSNYLDGTKNWAGWAKKGGWTFNGANAVCAAKNSVANWNDRIMSPLKKLKYSAVRGYKCTLSFEGVSADAWGTKGELNQLVVSISLLDANSQRIAHFNKTFMFTTSWVRKKVTLNLVDGSFPYDSGKSGVKKDMYLVFQVYNRSKHKVTLRKFKLERGTQATDWCMSWDDMASNASADAQAKANSALTKAYAKDTALDNALNQKGVWKRLTNNGAARLITLVNGQLYINADYINTGTLSANIIRAGVLADNLSTPKSKWNLNNGKFTTKDATLTDATVAGKLKCGSADSLMVTMENGQFVGYNKGKRQCSIDATSKKVGSYSTKMDMLIQAKSGVCIQAPNLLIERGNTNYRGYTGVLKWNAIDYIRETPNGIAWSYSPHSLQIVNGLITAVD